MSSRKRRRHDGVEGEAGAATTYGKDEHDPSQASILPARTKKASKASSGSRAHGGKRPVEAPSRRERRLSKSKQRKLDKLIDEKGKKARRVELYASLQATQLSEEEMSLLFHSGALGHTPSAREVLTRKLREEKAGIDTALGHGVESKSTQLYQPVPAEVKEEEEEEVDEDDEMEEDEAPRSAHVAGDGLHPDIASDDEDDDDDDEDDDDDDEDDDDAAGDDDDEEEEGMDDEGEDEDDDGDEREDAAGPGIRSRNLDAQRKRARFAVPDEDEEGAEDAPAASPSAFAFSVKLPAFATPIQTADASTAGAVSQETVKDAPGRHKVDAAMVKLQALRERNQAAAAMMPESEDESEEQDSKPVVPSAASTYSAAAERLASLPAGATAADTLRLLDAADRSMGDEFEEDDAMHFGGKNKRRKKKEAAAAVTGAPDEHMLRAAMWTADGSTVITQKTKLPDSSFSAYTIAPTRVKRDHKVAETRAGLPVVAMESEIMEALAENDVLVLAGETGSGKTTQVPQFLYECGYGLPHALLEAVTDVAPAPAPGEDTRPRPMFRGVPGMIGVTQPRRVAATAMAARVAHELGTTVGGKHGHVAYHVRYDGNTVTPTTRIKFMTDGILLREIQEDILLRKYSVIILDEAHERNINTDLLVGLLSRALPLRNQIAREQATAARVAMAATGAAPKHPLAPLKLIIMSATLRVDDFIKNTRLFSPPPPVVRVEARQHPVTVHFARRTELIDYMGEAFSKVVKIHTRLPHGAILVFVTGVDEVEDLVARLRKRFAVKKAKRKLENVQAAAAPVGAPSDGAGDAAAAADAEEEQRLVHVLPLYALLPPAAQQRVFQPPPPDHRLIVVATNVAETSLTIPDVRYVVDTGRVKRRVFDVRTGFSTYEVGWVAKSSADQRAGRAGRTGPGHCYRLYSSAVFGEQFAQFEDPEILRMPIEGVVLNMKTMGIQSVNTFPFPSPPPRASLDAAVRCLLNLGALVRDGSVETLTPLGRTLARIPLHPSLAKTLVLAWQQSNVRAADASSTSPIVYAIAMVASIVADQLFVRPPRAAAQQQRATSVIADADRKRGDGSGSDVSDAEEAADAARSGRERRLMASAAADAASDDEDAAQEAAEAAQLEAAALAAGKRLSSLAAVAKAQFRHPSSDALTALRATGAYAHMLETAGAAAASTFCRSNFLRLKAMKECVQLRRQLHSLLVRELSRESDSEAALLDDVAHAGAADASEELQVGAPAATTKSCLEFVLSLAPPNDSMQATLCQLLTAGSIERVARRAPPDRIPDLRAAAGMGASRNWIPYIAASQLVTDTLWIHPHSATFYADGSLLPQYITYQEIIRGHRAYMRGVTAVQPEWLHALAAGTPLCTYGEPLESPQPRYDASVDGVVAWCVPHFGDRTWILPAAMVPYPARRADAADVTLKAFARSLLEGHVAPQFARFTPVMAASPAIITKGLPHKRVLGLLEALQFPPSSRSKAGARSSTAGSTSITSALQLGMEWLRFPSYLLTEVRAWLPEQHHATLTAAWPQLIEASLAHWLHSGILPMPAA